LLLSVQDCTHLLTIEYSPSDIGFKSGYSISRNAFLLIWHSKYSAMLYIVHFYRLIFWRFCSLGASP